MANPPLHLSDFDFHLPPAQIAAHPAPYRDAARMLVIHRAAGTWQDRNFRELPNYLEPGDCLVVNDSRVFPSRLLGFVAPGGARAELFLLRSLGGGRWLALARPGKKLREGARIELAPDFAAEIVSTGERGERVIAFHGTGDPVARIEQLGHVPLPPYIHRPDTPEDRERYQTVYARERGSVAAPTAGLHFTPAILDRVRAQGASIAPVTLHVGLGTFQPLASDQVEANQLHSEFYSIPPDSWESIEAARRVVAVGTTSVRTIESAACTGELQGETSIFLYPGRPFQKTGALLTNFHLPKSSLLLLVCAFAGTELTLAAYKHAVAAGYRFFSYGDCMLLLE